MDYGVNHFGKRSQEVGGINFRIEEDLRGQESLIANIDIVFLIMSGQLMVSVALIPTHPSSHTVFASKSSKVLVWIGIILLKLLDDILTNIGVVFFNLFGYPKLVLGGNLCAFTPVTQELLHKVGNISASNRDVLD